MQVTKADALLVQADGECDKPSYTLEWLPPVRVTGFGVIEYDPLTGVISKLVNVSPFATITGLINPELTLGPSEPGLFVQVKTPLYVPLTVQVDGLCAVPSYTSL